METNIDEQIDVLLKINILKETGKLILPEPEENEIPTEKVPEPDEVDEDSEEAEDAIIHEEVQKDKFSLVEWLKNALKKLVEIFKELPAKIKGMMEKITNKIKIFRSIKTEPGSKPVSVSIKLIDKDGNLYDKEFTINGSNAIPMATRFGREITNTGKDLSTILRNTSQSAKDGIRNAESDPDTAKENKKEVIGGQKALTKRFSLIGSYYRACATIFNYLATNAQSKAHDANNQYNSEMDKYKKNDNSFNANNMRNSYKAGIKNQASADRNINKSMAYELKATRRGM